MGGALHADFNNPLETHQIRYYIPKSFRSIAMDSIYKQDETTELKMMSAPPLKMLSMQYVYNHKVYVHYLIQYKIIIPLPEPLPN